MCKKIMIKSLFIVLFIFSFAILSYGNNLIVNGDFEQGNTGFGTDYIYKPGPNNLWDPGTYAIGTNPNDEHDHFAIYGDQTSGSGNMFIANGATGNKVVWQQTVAVIPNSEYTFAYFLSSCVSTSPALVQTLINGTGLNVSEAPGTTGFWIKVECSWNSGSSTSATIVLKEITKVATGNDFAIDDISFSTTSITVGIDIKPGSDPNSININGNGVIPVAILGSEYFDVAQIDKSTLNFNGLEVRVKGNGQPQCSVKDVNGDGYDDLVCQFEDDTSTWIEGSSEGVVTGKLNDGTDFKGTDSINIVP